jgi:branched-chain amino acid aminotransferase
MSNFIYYLNGAFVPAEEAKLPLGDLGIVRGYGIFDLLRTYGRVPFKLSEHLLRLQSSSLQLELPLPGSLAEIEALVYQTLAHNGHPDNVTIRIVVTGGESANFIMPEDRPSLAIMLAPVREPPATLYQTGASLISVEGVRFMPTVKSLNYIPAVMMQKKIKQAGAIEALYRNHDGFISECGVSNFFMFRGDQLITPDRGILPGVTRAVTIEVAEDRFDVVQRPLHFSEISEADEVFITSTTKEIMPIVQIDGQIAGNGVVGERTRLLMQAFRRYVVQATQEGK